MGGRRSPWASRRESSWLGFKLGKAVCLVAGWRSSFLVGLQDLNTLASPGMTGWSWPVPSTAPRRWCYSHSAKGCYRDAVSSALRGEIPMTLSISSTLTWSPLENGPMGTLGGLPGIWANMFPSTTFRRFPLSASWDSLAMLPNTSGGRFSSSLFLKYSSWSRRQKVYFNIVLYKESDVALYKSWLRFMAASIRLLVCIYLTYTVDEAKSRCITASLSVTCKFLRPSNVDELNVDKKLLSRTSISRETSGPNVPAGMLLRLEPRYTTTSRNIYIARIIITVSDYLLLSKLRKRSCLSPVKAFEEILWMRFSDRSSTLRAIRGLKVLGGRIVSALRGRSRSDKFLIPANMSALRMLIWFCPNMRKRRFSRSYRVKR